MNDSGRTTADHAGNTSRPGAAPPDGAWLRAILDSAAGHAILTLDPAGRVTSWNTGARDLLGWEEAEALGMDGRLVFTPEDRDRGVPEAETARAAAEGRAEGERWHQRKDGGRFWAARLLVPLRGAAAPGFLAIVRDRTAEREADAAPREAERRQAFLLALGDRLSGLADPAEVAAAASEAVGRHLGVSRVGYGEADPGQEHAAVAAARDWTDGSVASVAGAHRVDDLGAPIAAALRAGRTVRVSDSLADPRTSPAGSIAALAAVQARAVLAVPLIKGGRLAATFFLHHREARPWPDADVALVEEVAERT
jgi:PAS domain S-box-containing protein